MCNLGKKWRRGVVYKSKNTNIEIGLNTGGGGCFSDGHGVVYKSKHSKIGLNRGGQVFFGCSHFRHVFSPLFVISH